MSVGHPHRRPNRLSHLRELPVLLRSGGAPALMRRWRGHSFDHDIPTLCGYDVDGTSRYADRDFLHCLHDSGYATHLLGAPIDTGLSPIDTLECCFRHEEVEKVLLDSDWPGSGDYQSCHEFATAAEHELAQQKGTTPLEYEHGLERIIQFCQHKNLSHVPPELAVAALVDEPDHSDRRILTSLRAHRVADADKVGKRSVSYGPASQSQSCSSCSMWQGQRNAMLAKCSLVEGLVRDNRVCAKWEPQSGDNAEAEPVEHSASAGPTDNRPAPDDTEITGAAGSSTPPAKPAKNITENITAGGRDQPAAAPDSSTPLLQNAQNNKTRQSEQNLNGGEMRDIILQRHGATKLNSPDISVDRIRGHKDVPLSTLGKKQAHAAGKRIKKDPPDVIVTSDLSRAKDTAQIVAKYCGLKVSEVTKAFRPWDVGDMAGTVSKKAIPILADYAANKPDEIAGKTGESFNTFKRRFLCGLLAVLRKYQGRVLIATHHRGERLVHAWAAGGYDPHGEVDIKIFNQKGEAPGSELAMTIPMSAIERFAMTSPEGDEKGNTLNVPQN